MKVRISRDRRHRHSGASRHGMQPAPRARRRGMTLIETLFATTGTVLLSIIGLTSACLLMTAQQQSAESLWVERTISSLADQLRADAHAATQFALTDDENGLFAVCTWLLPEDTQVTYTCASDGVVREEVHGSETPIVERFHLPFGRSWFERPAGEELSLITWRHEREIPMTAGTLDTADDAERPVKQYRVDVLPALHQSWESNLHPLHAASGSVAGDERSEAPIVTIPGAPAGRPQPPSTTIRERKP